MRKGLRAASVGLIAAMTMAVFSLPPILVGAESREIIAVNSEGSRGNGNENGDGFFRDSNAVALNTVTDNESGNAYLQVSSAQSNGFRRLCQRLNKTLANSLASSDEAYRLVIKTRLRADENNAEWVNIGFSPAIPTADNVLWLASIANASSAEGGQLVKVMSGYEQQATVVRDETNPVGAGSFVPLVIAFDVPAAGGDPELSFYADGVSYKYGKNGDRFTMPRSDLDTILGGATPRLTYHSGDTSKTAVWSIDDSGMYAVYDEPEPFTAVQTDFQTEQGSVDITIPFSNELYTDAFRADDENSLITLRGETGSYTMPMADISTDDLQKSLILRNIPIAEGGRYEISFDGAKDIFGQEYSGSAVTVSCSKMLRITGVNGGSRAEVSKGASLCVKFSDKISLEDFYGKVLFGKAAGRQELLPDSVLSLASSNELSIDLSALDLTDAITYGVRFADGITGASGGEWAGTKQFWFRVQNQSERFSLHEDYSKYTVGTSIGNNTLENMTYDSSASAAIGEEGMEHYMPLRLGSGQTTKQLRLNFGDAVENILPSIRLETKIKLLAASDTYNARLRFQTLEASDPSINVVHFVNGKISVLQAPTAAGAVQVGDVANDVWYTVRIDVNYQAETPVMAITIQAEDGSVDFHGMYDASLSNILTVSNPSSWGKVGRAGLIIASGEGLTIRQSYINVTETEPVKIISLSPGSDWTADDLNPQITVTADGPVLAGENMAFVNRAGERFPAVLNTTGFGTGEITPIYPLRSDSVYTVNSGDCVDIAGNPVVGGSSVKVSTPKAQPLSISLSGYTPSSMAAGDVTANLAVNNSGTEEEVTIAMMYCGGTFDAPVIWGYEKVEYNIPAGSRNVPITINVPDNKGFIKVVVYNKNNKVFLEDSYPLGVSQETEEARSEVSGTLETPCVPVLLNVADGKFVYQSLTDENGQYQFKFSAGDLLPTGVYSYTVTAGGEKTESGEVSVTNPYEKQTFVTALNNATAENIAEIYEAGKKNVNPDEGLRSKLTDRQFYDAIVSSVQKEPFRVDDFDGQMNRMMLVACFNLGLYDELNDEFFSFADMDKKYVGYYNDITAEGKSALMTQLKQEKYTTFYELQARTKEQIVVDYIRNNKGAGAAFVYDVLNGCGAELGLNLTAYNNLSSKERQTANGTMVNASGDISLQTMIDNAVAAVLSGSTNGSNSGGASSGGGGGGAAAAMPSNPATLMTPEDVAAFENSTGINLVFHDLKSHVWAQPAIDVLYQNGIVNGKSEGVFEPDSAVTRAEYTKMLMSALELLQSDLPESSFNDVTEADWHYAPVLSAAKLNIVNGMSENYFGAEENITRQDAAVIAFRAAKYTALTLDSDIEDVSFDDQSDIDNYAQTAAKVLKKMQIINGFEDGNYRPRGTTTRAEAAVIIYRIYHLLKGGA